jgi:hypothetical protein
MPKSRKRRLTVLRQFFRLAAPSISCWSTPPKACPPKNCGRTLTIDQRRALFHGWTAPADAHPHEALISMLALLRAASSQETRLLSLDDIDYHTQALDLGNRRIRFHSTPPAGPCCNAV